MDEILQINHTKKEVMYPFRFMPSNKCIHLNQQQLDQIPYLVALVEHKDDFLSCQNENNEFILNPPIDYNWFVAILHSINSEQPYSLFTELEEDENILNTLELFDYLGVNLFFFPLLKEKNLMLSSPRNANLSETRNTAAKFLIAIYKNEYNLFNTSRVENIFDLIMIIISRPDIFSSRFRHHTFTIVKEHCFPFFTTKQKYELTIKHYRTQKQRKLNSLMYLYDDNNSLPDNFDLSFAGKCYYMPKKENDTEPIFYYPVLIRSGPPRIGKSKIIKMLFNIDTEEEEDPPMRIWEESWPLYYSLMNRFYEERTLYFVDTPGLEICRDHDAKELGRFLGTHKKKMEAKSTRAGYFNTLPKRSKIDKFKHRSGPKAQKHR